MKCCTKCKILKDIEEFPKRRNKCKKCINIYYRIFKENKFEDLRKYREEYREKNKESLKNKRDIYYFNNKELLKNKSYKYREEKKDIINEKKRLFYKNNRNKINNYISKRTKKDPLFKMSCRIRSLIRISLKRRGYSKSSKTHKILGCSFSEFKNFIENKFEPWMNWDNYGVFANEYNKTWQFDHIIPVSIANSENELIILNYYTNFRPLCSKKNLEKSDAIYS